MDVLVNHDYGVFELSDKAKTLLKDDELLKDIYKGFRRNDPKLLEVYDTLQEEFQGKYSTIGKVTIPEEVTDFMITSCDGWESVYYVLDGKLYDLEIWSDGTTKIKPHN